jgi:hypothetical protein
MRIFWRLRASVVMLVVPLRKQKPCWRHAPAAMDYPKARQGGQSKAHTHSLPVMR